jgi:hypothetical protein
VLRPGDDAVADERLQVRMLPLNESKPQQPPYRALPRSKTCSEAEAGVW